jgi:hypothetical protein
MKRIASLTGLMALIVATLFAASATFGSGSASAGSTEISCKPVGSLFRCDVSNPQGIAQVRVLQGGVVRIEQTLSGCPIRTSVGPFTATANSGRLSVSVKLCGVIPATSMQPSTGMSVLKGPGAPTAHSQKCGDAECGSDWGYYDFVDPSCYAHEGADALPWCQDEGHDLPD